MWAYILPELFKAVEAEPENEVLAELLSSVAKCVELLGAGCLGEPGMEEVRFPNIFVNFTKYFCQ